MAYTTINKSTDNFNTKLYTGNGSTQSITGVGFQVDFNWLKSRTQTEGHYLQDVIRGSTKHLHTNNTDAEDTAATAVTSFDSDGFTLGNKADLNGSGNTYCSWNWKAGTGQGSSNTDGSINTTYTSVNTTAGFSISKFTGTGSAATVGHGLGVKPSMIIAKSTTISNNWIVQHGSLGATNTIFLDNTNPSQTGTSFWNDTEPTSSVFSLGNWSGINTSGSGIIAYCFAEKAGYSKFGSYTGNGNADGTFVYTGFKPAFLIVKRTDTANFWLIRDNKRDTFNVSNKTLNANGTDTEASWGSTYLIDYLSNGFKCRDATTPINASGGTYIYMAFGQSLVGSNNVPCTAR